MRFKRHFFDSEFYQPPISLGEFMAHHKSAKKRIRQTEKRTERNRGLRSNLRSTVKKFQQTLQAGEMEQAENNFSDIQRSIDKAVSKGIIHRNTASRKKSRLSIALTKAQAETADAMASE